jgi:ribose transport system ATP-binding protein
MTEITKALSKNARILIMDEPTSSLTENETEVLFRFIKKLKEKGISVIYISHRMDEIFEICDRTTILRDGKWVLTESHDSLTIERMIEHIIGGNMEQAFVWSERQYDRTGEPLLRVSDLHSGSRVRGVSFDLHRGEILGIAGLMGSGRSEAMRALFGIDPIDRGRFLSMVRKRQFAARAMRLRRVLRWCLKTGGYRVWCWIRMSKAICCCRSSTG